MNRKKPEKRKKSGYTRIFSVVSVVFAALICPFNIFSEIRPQSVTTPVEPPLPDSIPLARPLEAPSVVTVDSLTTLGEQVEIQPIDTVGAIAPVSLGLDGEQGKLAEAVYQFNPDPTRAVWLSALFPGLGQLYNRRYWKLPIVIGAYMGLGYATSWNNGMLRDYSRAYSDLMDNDPMTKSYMDFFPPTTQEESLDRTWLMNVMQTRKNYYRRNRDLCIICMVGVYLVAMVDAYVDASLSHFDISPDLSMDVTPAVIPDSRNRPGLGLQWALNF